MTITVPGNRTEEMNGTEKVAIYKNHNKTIGLYETDRIGKNWSTKVGKNKTATIGIAYLQNIGLNEYSGRNKPDHSGDKNLSTESRTTLPTADR